MTSDDLDDALWIVGVMLIALRSVVPGQAGRQGAALRYAIGDLQANAPALLRAGTIGLPLLECFQLAYYAGATLTGMASVRTAIAAQTPVGVGSAAVATAGIRFALGREARILAGTTFTSSQDVFTALAQQNAAYEAAEEYAADNRDPAAYQALIAMHAAVTRDLTTRAVSLPTLVTYSMPRILTSHALANRLYGDASRADELRLVNTIIHPAFMPLTGTALSE